MSPESPVTPATLEEAKAVITQLQMKTDELQTRYHALLDHLQSGVYLIEDGAFVFVNNVLADMLGYKIKEMIGKSIVDFIAPEHFDLVMSNYVNRMKGLPAQRDYTFNLLHSDGETRVPVNIRAGTAQIGGKTLAVGTLENLTEHQRLLDQTETIDRLLSETQRIANIAGWEFDALQRTITWTDQVYTILDTTPEEFQPTIDGMLKFYHPDDAPAITKALQETIEAAAEWSLEVRATTAQGRQIWLHIQGRPVFDGDIVAKVAGTAQDITEQRQAEAERLKLQAQVIEAQERALAELSAPIIPLVDRILIVPLIGSIDDGRARTITRALLAGIGHHRAQIVILDITGVPMVDSGVADLLDKTVQAARLKGAHTIISGISDAVAETIIELGIDWGELETVRDMQSALLAAIQQQGLGLTRLTV